MAILIMNWFLNGSIVFFGVLVGIYFYLARNFNYWKKLGVKQISPSVPFGNFGPCILARKALVDLLQEMYEIGQNEPYIGFYILEKPSLLIRDPELIKYICIKDFKYFTDRMTHSSDSDSLKNNLFAMRNLEWKHMRSKLSPIFTSNKMKQMFEQILEIGKDLDFYMNELKLKDGHVLDVKTICTKFTIDVIGLTIYRLKFNCLRDPDSPLIKAGLKIFQRSYARYIEHLCTLLIEKYVKIFDFHLFGKSSGKFLSEIFLEAMNQRKYSKSIKNDSFDILINLQNNLPEDQQNNYLKITTNDLMAQATVLFTGGFETSSSTMTFTLYELAKNPNWQQKVRKELWTALAKNNGKFTYEMITSVNSLPCLDMVISETLRMYPILHYLDRKTTINYQIPGTKLILEKGTPIIIPMRAIHLDAKHFPKPHVYDPERFSVENKRNIKPNTYFPFGDGPRICIGMRLGLMLSKLGLCHLLSRYEYSPSEETPTSLCFDNYSVPMINIESITLKVKQIS